MPARGLGPLEETATERPMCCEAAGNRPPDWTAAHRHGSPTPTRLRTIHSCSSVAQLCPIPHGSTLCPIPQGSTAGTVACAIDRTAQQHRSSGRQRGGWEMGVGIEV